LCVAPFGRFEETSDDRGKLAGELLDRSDQYSGSLRIARDENAFELGGDPAGLEPSPTKSQALLFASSGRAAALAPPHSRVTTFL
jgi:hypothetical protein